MRWGIQSRLVKEWNEGCVRRRRLAFRPLRWLWLPVCYLGMIIAPAICSGITLEALRLVRSAFWSAVVLWAVFIVWSIWRSARVILSYIRARKIELDIFVVLVSFTLAFVFLTYTLATSFYFRR